MSKKLMLGAGLAVTALALPAFAMVMPNGSRSDAASTEIVKPLLPGTLRLAALKLSAPDTVAATPSPKLEAEADDGLPPVDITGPAR